MNNRDLIAKFYDSFTNGDADGMAACYSDDVLFEDPAFGELTGDRARGMWKMLLSRGDTKPEIQYYDIDVDGDSGSVKWVAKYAYGPQKRAVVNEIAASFRFADGKIVDHRDHFDLWKWTRQAMGISGMLLGWTDFMKSKIQAKTNSMLTAYLDQQ